jgi:hypothetical protein
MDRLKELWMDDAGVIVTMELLFLYVILILGLIAGWTNLRAALDTELTEMANSLLALDQGYSITGAIGCNTANFSNGITATDTPGNVTWSQAPAAGAPVSIDVTACP